MLHLSLDMYVGIDIGGTKVLMASFTNEGQLRNHIKLPTPKLYDDLISLLHTNVAQLDDRGFQAAGVAIPGLVDREAHTGISFGNLGWRNVPIGRDLGRRLHCPVVIENDAKAGALSEALLIKNEFKNVLYIAIGTGIGVGYVSDGKIETNFADRGGNQLLLEYNGHLRPWESFASGKAIVQRFGKKASEITDKATWKIIAHDLALGIVELIALVETDAVVLGGGVGSYFERYEKYLKAEMEKYATPVLPTPAIRQAQHPEEAVVYGCYQLAKVLHENTVK